MSHIFVSNANKSWLLVFSGITMSFVMSDTDSGLNLVLYRREVNAKGACCLMPGQTTVFHV